MKPLLKWVGGKTQLLTEILKEIPDNINGTYHEPFVGGGSIMLAVLEEKRPRGGVVASDANATLIEFWRAVRDNPEKLYREVRELVQEFEVQNDEEKKEYYYQIRDSFNTNRTPSKFIFLNKTCFRGLWREGPHGFNVPYGHYKRPEILNHEHLMKVHNLIQGVEFNNMDWKHSLEKPIKGDWVYLDPPYCETFTGYTKGSWTSENHQDLFNTIRNLNSSWVMSNSDTQLVKDYFENRRVVEARRAINSKNPGEKANEVIISSTNQ